MYPPLNLPTYSFQLKHKPNGAYVFDIIRKKDIKLTPEEWVRQHFLVYMIHHLGYPAGLISVEYGLTINKLNKRSDIVVFDKTGQPLLIVECKAPTVSISQETFDQIATYNLNLNVKYLIVTNGLQHYCCQMSYNPMSYLFLDNIPTYTKLLAY